MLVLDDLHAADEPSLLLLQFVARELADAPSLVLGAYRDVDPTLTDPLATTLAALAREPVTRRLALSGLSETDVAQFVPDRERAVVAAVHAETEGNPLFVGEVARLLGKEGPARDPAQRARDDRAPAAPSLRRLQCAADAGVRARP